MDPATATEQTWHVAFLATLATTGNVSAAARAAGVSRQAAYHRRSNDRDFRAAWDDALEEGVDALEAEARRRALEGVEEPVFHAGAQCGTVRRFSDALMVVLLRAHRPHKFSEKHRVDVKAEVVHRDEEPEGDLDDILAAMGYHKGPARQAQAQVQTDPAPVIDQGVADLPADGVSWPDPTAARTTF